MLESMEATDGWATLVRASRPPMTIMGSLGGIEAGLRQLRRSHPLETMVVGVGDGLEVVAPTPAGALRVKAKAYLVMKRNVVRDYLDVVALAGHLGTGRAVEVLSHIDDACGELSLRLSAAV